MTSSVLIDGSNFFFKLKALGLNQAVFDYAAFARWLTGEQNPSCTYYVGAVKQERGNPKGEQL